MPYISLRHACHSRCEPASAPAEALTMMASSREVGISSTLRYASTVDTFRPAVSGAEPSLVFSARMVSWLAFSSKSSWFSFCFFLHHHRKELDPSASAAPDVLYPLRSGTLTSPSQPQTHATEGAVSSSRCGPKRKQ